MNKQTTTRQPGGAQAVRHCRAWCRLLGVVLGVVLAAFTSMAAWAEDPAIAIGASLTTSQPAVQPLGLSRRHQLAIVIDDLGYSLDRDQRALALPAQLTVAVLPRSPWASNVADLALRAGKEVILHQPMQTHSRSLQEEGGILWHGMSAGEIEATLGTNLNAVPGSVGINNHRGSLLTTQPDAMAQLMRQLQQRGLYFLDSRTSAATVAHNVARDLGVPTLKRDVFLDHVRTPEAVHHEFQRALQIARRQGYAVLIAHPHPVSLDYLANALVQLPGDIETTTLSNLIARGQGPAAAAAVPARRR